METQFIVDVFDYFIELTHALKGLNYLFTLLKLDEKQSYKVNLKKKNKN